MAVDEGGQVGRTPPSATPTEGPRIRRGDYVVNDGGVWEWDGTKYKFVDTVRNMREKTGLPPRVFRDGRIGPKDRRRVDAQLNTTVGGGQGPGSSNDRLPDGTEPGGSTPAPQPASASGGGGGGGRGGRGGGDDEDAADPTKAKYEIWEVDGTKYVVFFTPRTRVPMVWEIRGKGEEQRWTQFGVVETSRTLTREEFRETGRIKFGDTRELRDPGELEHPFVKFNQAYRDEVAVKPWLRDPEIFALHAAAFLETGGEPTQDQIRQTDWWNSLTDEEKAAQEKWAGPQGPGSAEFDETYATTRGEIEKDLIAAGFDFAGGNKDRVLDWLTKQVMWGHLNEAEYTNLVEQASNPYAIGALPTAGFDRLPEGAEAVRYQGRTYIRHNGRDYALAHGLETAQYGKGARKVDEINEAGALHDPRNLKAVFGGAPQGRDAQGGIEQVRALVREWGGPLIANGFSETEIARWAAKIEQNPEAQQELVAKLRNRRKVLYPQYADENMTYEDIAAPYRGLVQSVWGQRIDEADPFFQGLLQANDVNLASQQLRNEGLKRGVAQVSHRALADLSSALGGQVVRSVV